MNPFLLYRGDQHPQSDSYDLSTTQMVECVWQGPWLGTALCGDFTIQTGSDIMGKINVKRLQCKGNAYELTEFALFGPPSFESAMQVEAAQECGSRKGHLLQALHQTRCLDMNKGA